MYLNGNELAGVLAWVPSGQTDSGSGEEEGSAHGDRSLARIVRVFREEMLSARVRMRLLDLDVRALARV